MASFKVLAPPLPGERFTYVYIPADMSKPLEERSESSEGGLESDALMKTLKTDASEIGPNVDIIALTVPTVHSEFIAVSIYHGAKSDRQPVNARAMGLMSACGLKSTNEIKGDAFVSRYADNDDDVWKRINIGKGEISSDAAWVVASAARNKGRSTGGSSLSSILGQHATNMAAQSGQQVAMHPLLGGQGGSFGGGSGGGGGGGNNGAAGEGSPAPEGGCKWTQTPEEIEVVCPMPVGCGKGDVKVKFLCDRLEVSLCGKVEASLTGRLGGAVDIDGCTWTLDKGSLVVSLEKKAQGDWPFALRQE